MHDLAAKMLCNYIICSLLLPIDFKISQKITSGNYLRNLLSWYFCKTQCIFLTALPSEPRNLKTENLQNTSAVISWTTPVKTGGLQLWYSLKCDIDSDICNEIRYQQSAENITSSSIQITNLRPYTWYTFTVYSQNAVVKISGRPKRSSSTIKFQTMPGCKWNFSH